MTRTACVRAAWLALGLLSSALPAHAQQRLFAFTRSTVVEINSSPDRLGQVVAMRPIPDLFDLGGIEAALTAGGGRYIVWSTGYGNVFRYDIAADDLRALDGVTAGYLAAGAVFATDRTGNMLISATSTQSGPTTISRTDLRTLETHVVTVSNGRNYTSMALAQAANKIVGLWNNSNAFLDPFAPRFVDIIDLESGAVDSLSVSIPYQGCQRIATNADASRLWVAGPSAYGAPYAPAGYGAFDLLSGALLGYNPTETVRYARPASCPDVTLTVDETRGVVLAATAQGLAAFDAGTMKTLATADTPRFDLRPDQLDPAYGGWFDYQILESPTASAVYTFDTQGEYRDYDSRCIQGSLVALSPTTGARLATTNFSGCPAGDLVLASAPAAPGNLSASLTGSHVDLAWDAPAQAVAYQLEAGTAPGLSNLVRLNVDAASLGIDGVPPGTYYVRVRAVNYAGTGAPSQELVVRVP